MSRIVAAACAAVLSGGLVLAPTVAHAQVTAVDDGTDDLWVRVMDPETGEESWAEAVADVNIDVTRAVVKHTAKRIAVTVTYLDLEKGGAFHSSYWSYFKLADGRRAAVSVSNGEDGAEWAYITIQKEPGGGYDKNLECPGLTFAWEWSADTMTVSFPRSCYDKPAWLRFHGTSVGIPTDPEPGHEYDWIYDNAGDPGPDEGTRGPSGPWTSKVKAG